MTPRHLYILWLRSLAGLLVAVGIASAAFAQDPPPTEFQVKAAFLYKLATFVEWPENTWATTEDSITFAVLGQDPFGPTLDSIISGNNVSGHPIKVIRAQRLGQLEKCQVLFICPSEVDRLPAILTELQTYPVLVASDLDPAIAPGIMVYLRMSEAKVRLAINNYRVTEAGLSISSRVLKLADLLDEGAKP